MGLSANPASPTVSRYFFGMMAPFHQRRFHKSGAGILRLKSNLVRTEDLDIFDPGTISEAQGHS